MNKINYTFTALFIILFSSTQAQALENIKRPYQSVRSAGMGNVRITTGLYDENFFANPARAAANPTWRVTLFDPMVETSPATISHASSIASSNGDDQIQKIAETAGDNIHARIQTTMPSFYSPNKEGKYAWSLGLITSTQMDLDLRRSYSLDPVTIVDIGPAFTLARRFMAQQELVVGFTSHLAYRAATRQAYNLADFIKGTSLSPSKSGDDGAMLDFDLGATYEFKHWTPADFHFHAGLAIDNLMGGKYSNISLHALKAGTNPPAQPTAIGFGFAAQRDEVDLWALKLRDFMAAIELTDIGNNKDGSIFRLLHMGGEFRWKVLKPRVGINQGYFCMGLGIDLKLVNIDVATYGEEMSLNTGGLEDRRYALKIAFQL